MKITIQHFTLIIGFILPSLKSIGQELSQPLFEKKEVLPMRLETNLKILLKEKVKTHEYHWAKLSYTGDQNDSVVIPMKLKVRGNFRLSSGTCNFPPLLLNFSKKKIKNTLFEHQDKLKLVTQCADPEYVVREYMVYEIYNLLTNLSFKARLTDVTYIDSLGKIKPKTSHGFFIENELAIAKRISAESFTRKNLKLFQLDTMQSALVTMFEYLIGNHDWSVPGLHNIKIYIQPGKLFLPIPYDFDHAGIVEARYALPPVQLEISSVRERLYRGLDYSPEVFKKIFDKFNDIKPQLYALYESNPLLDAKYIKRTLQYFDEFYAEINDPKGIKKHFTGGRTKN